MIAFQNIDVRFRLKNRRKISSWIKDTIVSENKSIGDIAIAFCSDKYLLEMNIKYLKHNTLTDIITFDYSTENRIISGDIAISIDRVKENANTYKCEFLNELHRIIIHGVLHLLGYEDKTPDQKMKIRSKENYYLTLLDV